MAEYIFKERINIGSVCYEEGEVVNSKNCNPCMSPSCSNCKGSTSKGYCIEAGLNNDRMKVVTHRYYLEKEG